jgi:hypothetical protein
MSPLSLTSTRGDAPTISRSLRHHVERASRDLRLLIVVTAEKVQRAVDHARAAVGTAGIPASQTDRSIVVVDISFGRAF